MAEELKNLIDKIREEGIEAAGRKAHAIEEEAKQRGIEIIEKAKKESQNLIAKAKEEAAKAETAVKASLDQAARDFFISLRKGISATLDRVILSDVRGALSAQGLADIITGLIKECVKSEEGDVIVRLNKSDAEKVQKALIGKVKEELKKEITLRPEEDITGGFIMSFDGGKSYYDFTDKALAEYISSHVQPKLGELLKNTAGK